MSYLFSNIKWTIDKFGETMFACSNCRTQRDYIHYLAINSTSFYISSILMIIIGSIFQKTESKYQYWRCAFLLMLFYSESAMLFQDKPMFLGSILSSLPYYQQIIILQHYYLITFLALSNIGPIWFQSTNDPTIFKNTLQELEVLSKAQLIESHQKMEQLTLPFKGDKVSSTELVRKMKDNMIEMRLSDLDIDLKTAYKTTKSRMLNKNK